MNKYEWLDEYLLAKPGVAKDYKLEWGWWRYQVGGKLFAATCQLGPQYKGYDCRELLSLKCEPKVGGAEQGIGFSGRISAGTSLTRSEIRQYFLRALPRSNKNSLRKNCFAPVGEEIFEGFSLRTTQAGWRPPRRTRRKAPKRATDGRCGFNSPNLVLAELLRKEYPDIIPGFYMDKRCWNSIFLDGAVPEDVLHEISATAPINWCLRS